MKTNAYTVHDSCALTYGVPFFALSDALAQRSFKFLVEDPTSTVGRSPGDFSLYFIGVFDDSIGQLDAAPLKLICRATDFPRYINEQ